MIKLKHIIKKSFFKSIIRLEEEVKLQKIELELHKNIIENQAIELDVQKLVLENHRLEFDAQKIVFESYKAELDVQKIAFENYKVEFDAQKIAFENYKAELEAQKAELISRTMELKNDFNFLKRREEDILVSTWLLFGEDRVNISKIKESLYSPYCWDVYSTHYWMVCFSVLIKKEDIGLVDKFLPIYVKRHGFELIDRYLIVANYAGKLGIINDKIKDASFVYQKLKENNQNELIKKYFLNKKIAIVGNGKSEIGRARGSEIDNHDIVVRFNNYRTEGFEVDYGSKTNVWVRGSGGDDVIDKQDISQYDLVIFEADYEHFMVHFDNLEMLKNYLMNSPEKCCNFDFETHLTLKNKSGIVFPSTGLVAIWGIIQIVGKENIQFYGFSFQENNPEYINSHYFDDRSDIESIHRTGVHNMQEESIFIQKECI